MGYDRALHPNIRLGWKCSEVAKTLAYYNMATITAVNSFIVQAPGVIILLNFNILKRFCAFSNKYNYNTDGTKFITAKLYVLVKLQFYI
jgi:hypothetical protein